MPPHPKHHEPQWIYNAEGEVTRDSAAQLLERFSQQLRAGGTIDLEGTTVTIPENSHAVVRLERTPRGATALRFTLEWADESTVPERRGLDGLLA